MSRIVSEDLENETRNYKNCGRFIELVNFGHESREDAVRAAAIVTLKRQSKKLELDLFEFSSATKQTCRNVKRRG